MDQIAERLKIDDQDLASMAERIRPIVRFSVSNYDTLEAGEMSPTGLPFWIEIPNLRSIAFTWEPKPLHAAHQLTQATHLITYHKYGAPALFKPSIAEVLAQLRYAEKNGRLSLSNIIAFEVDPGDLYAKNIFGDYHWAPTILYHQP